VTDKEIIKEYKYQVKYGAGDPKILDLINRQQAEIERLEYEIMKTKLEKHLLNETVEEIKSEAIKEFAEKLERIKRPRSLIFESDYMFTVTMMEIDNFVKEMVGDSQ
jgi:hypothetical protein